MGAFVMKTVGLNRLQNLMKGSKEKLQSHMFKQMKIAVEVIIGETKRNIRGSRASNPPEILGIRTGRLRSSITGQTKRRRGNVVGTIGTNVDYAAKHEFGLEGLPKRPFITPALEKKADEVQDILATAFDKTFPTGR